VAQETEIGLKLLGLEGYPTKSGGSFLVCTQVSEPCVSWNLSCIWQLWLMFGSWLSAFP